jgi:glycerol-3-phosphate dehydrogenase
VLPDGQLQDQQIQHLQGNHGLNALSLIASAPASEREPLSDVIPVCLAEVRHAVQHEHARSWEDVLARRCRLAMVDTDEARRVQPLVDQVLDQADESPAVAAGD